MAQPAAGHAALTDADYEALAAMRLAMRRLQAFSEAGAKSHGLTAAQHQALLAIRGAFPGRRAITIGELAEQLLLKHHSAVGLTARMVESGLIRRERSSEDRRRIYLTLTPQGEALLHRITQHNIGELLRASDAFLKFFRRLSPES
jgi:DNA-binding MarR family transcriptional regulator